MKRRGWIITDVIVSISLVIIFAIPLLNINKAILHHLQKQETNQAVIDFLEYTISDVLLDQSAPLPLSIENDEFKMYVTSLSVIDKKIEALSIEIKSKEDESLNAFTIYREAINEE